MFRLRCVAVNDYHFFQTKKTATTDRGDKDADKMNSNCKVRFHDSRVTNVDLIRHTTITARLRHLQS